jgi:putative cell wall-binding protein
MSDRPGAAPPPIGPRTGSIGDRRPERAAVIALAGVLVLGTLAMPPPSRAAEPAEAAGQRHLADTLGGSPNDFELLYERTSTIEHSVATLWAAKYVDRRTGEIHAVVHDAAAGQVAGLQLQSERAADAIVGLAPLAVKADPELIEMVGAREAGASVGVGVWLDVDVTAAEQAVMARHPELVWDGDRPIVGDLGAARMIRAELDAAGADARASALEALRLDAEALGGTIGYASTSAPLAYVDLPAGRVADLAALPNVETLGLERTWKTSMASAGPAVQANWTVGAEDEGNGVRVAVVEYHNVRDGGDLAGRLVAYHSVSGALAFTGGGLDHPTWVAGAISGRTGVAPGSLIVSSSTGGGGAGVTRDRQIIAAADWAANAAGGNADVINASIGQDTATGSEEARRYFDAIVDRGGRLAVAAAGNFTTFGHWDIVSPGTAHNVLTVGGIDDLGSAYRGDDRLWYLPGSNGSNYRDRTDAAWNTHGDYNKPNVSAPAASVVTANGLGASGTSVASPIVAGIAAQLIARLPSLALRPEATRALIMAGAVNRTAMPDGSLNADHEGTGTASAMWANSLLTAGDAPRGGHRMGSMTPGETIVQEIAVTAGQRIKVVVAWNSRSDGTTDRLMADLDLRVFGPDGAVASSLTFDNNYEWVEFIAGAGGTARIEVRQARFEDTSERYGLAWAKSNVGTPGRIAGADRYATAAAISRSQFGPGVPVAFVATGRNFPDALAVGPVAGMQGGPVLLTDPNSLPQATADELARLRPGRIVVAGGPGAVSDQVAQAVQAYTSQPVSRMAGADRYETAAAVSRASFGPGVSAVFIATGRAFPDALAAGPAAIRMGGPVLLTQPGSLPGATRDELARLRPARIFVVGGSGVVGDGVISELRAFASQLDRVAGPDRYATAAAISSVFFGASPSIYLATGTNYPDALASVPAAGRSASPLLLVRGSQVPAPVTGELVRIWPPRTWIVGGTSVIGDGVMQYLTSLLGKP